MEIHSRVSINFVVGGKSVDETREVNDELSLYLAFLPLAFPSPRRQHLILRSVTHWTNKCYFGNARSETTMGNMSTRQASIL